MRAAVDPARFRRAPVPVTAAVTLIAVALAAPLLGTPPADEAADGTPTIEEKTEGMELLDGFLPLYWDEEAGKVWLEIPRPGQEMIYVQSLATGIGSNDIGLDRGQLGATRVVSFERHGPKVLLVQPNTGYRAVTDNPAERRAVEEAFADSVIWGFEVAAETPGGDDGPRLLVDATGFLLRDAHDVAGRLARTDQGTFRLEESRSAPVRSGTRAFPENTELEATLTFVGDEPGDLLQGVAPTPGAVTVRQHHSFVALPEPGYQPRRSHPGAGFFGITWLDYAAPISEPLEQRFIARHRLEKADPGAEPGEPVEPIVYYLDPGTPEPVRSALLDGARWWNRAFEAAGYRNAFRVEMLPDGADMLDVRYNVIQWVHRSTRGWSYGGGVIDPRTGEILKGHVSLGSLRVRQDYLIAEGLLSPYGGEGETPAAMREMALARIRQLAAHEVGHTLGLAHNYVASSQGRASVMDYPHPLVRLDGDGELDLSDAYDVGVGEWDEVAIAYGYRDFPDDLSEAVVRAELEAILRDARERGLTFLTDQDARPAGSAHPRAHLWDNGEDPVTELRRTMRVRRAALDRFGVEAIRRGEPLATLEEVLVPLYLHHRYQVEAATKVIAGAAYTYALRGDGQEPIRVVDGEDQRRALDAVLATLDPAELTLSREILELIPPRPFTYPLHRELFERTTGTTFDPVSPAAAAAGITLTYLLDPVRAARLIAQHALDPALPGLGEVIDRTREATFGHVPADGYRAEVGRAVEGAFVDRLLRLAATAPMPQVRAVAAQRLEDLRDRLSERLEGAGSPPAASPATGPAVGEGSPEAAHYARIVRAIDRFLERTAGEAERPAAPEPPPGSPIGSAPDVPDLGCDYR